MSRSHKHKKKTTSPDVIPTFENKTKQHVFLKCSDFQLRQYIIDPKKNENFKTFNFEHLDKIRLYYNTYYLITLRRWEVGRFGPLAPVTVIAGGAVAGAACILSGPVVGLGYGFIKGLRYASDHDNNSVVLKVLDYTLCGVGGPVIGATGGAIVGAGAGAAAIGTTLIGGAYAAVSNTVLYPMCFVYLARNKQLKKICQLFNEFYLLTQNINWDATIRGCRLYSDQMGEELNHLFNDCKKIAADISVDQFLNAFEELIFENAFLNDKNGVFCKMIRIRDLILSHLGLISLSKKDIRKKMVRIGTWTIGDKFYFGLRRELKE